MIVFGKLFRIDDVRTLHALDVPWNAVDAHQSVASTDVVNSVARPSQRAPMDQDASGDQLEPKKFYGELEKIDSGKKDKGRCNWDQFAANRKIKIEIRMIAHQPLCLMRANALCQALCALLCRRNDPERSIR